MSNEKSLYTLISLENFKSIFCIDDRDDRLVRFCLVTSTLSIEQFCKRNLLRKKYFETFEFSGDLEIHFKEYPVSEILAAFLIMRNEKLEIKNEEFLEPEFYRPMFGSEFNKELPFSLLLSPSVKRFSRLLGVKVIYWAGYSINEKLEMRNEKCKKIYVPADLASACLELAMWNFNRYKGKRVGMTGNIKGAGKEGEHFEMSMPENVKQLLEPYRRRTI